MTGAGRAERDLAGLLSLFLCPECREGDLAEAGEDRLRCTRCGQDFPVVDGVPLLFRSRDLERYLESDPQRPPRPDKPSQAGGAAHWREYGIEDILPPAAEGRDILLLGCGDAGETSYLRDLGFRPIGFDIRRGPGTDFLSDAHRIGIKDGSIDVVLSMQVLEHLRAPWDAIREVGRVLRPGGCFVGSVAFMKPYHGSYFHMTHDGVHALCGLAELEVDRLYGAQSLTYTLYGGMIPFGGRRLRMALLSPVDRALLALRARAWAWSRRLDPDEPRDRFHTVIPMSFRQFDRLRAAPAVVFRAWKPPV